MYTKVPTERVHASHGRRVAPGCTEHHAGLIASLTFFSFFLYHYSFPCHTSVASSCAGTRQTSPAPIERVSGCRRAFPRWKVPVGIHSSHHTLTHSFSLPFSLLLFVNCCVVLILWPPTSCSSSWGSFNCLFFVLFFFFPSLPTLFISSQGLLCDQSLLE